MTISRVLALALALTWIFAPSGRAAEFAIRDGDRVVFLGDSITEQRLYTTYIEAYALTRYPTRAMTFRNVGWGGDTSWLRQRAHPDESRLFAAEGADLDTMVQNAVRQGLERDVLPLRPTFVTVKFGMNDHSYQAFRPDIFRAYRRSQAEIAKDLQAAGARVTFLTPQPIEERRPDPDKDVRNQSLAHFAAGLQKVAAQSNAGFVNLFDPFMAVMLAERSKTPAAFIGGGDAVHPGPAGQTLMAWIVLKGLGATAPVSAASLDVASRAVTAERCRVDNVKIEGGKVTFDRLDEALPLPIDTRAEAALKLAPVVDELSLYTLRVSGLAVGNYAVLVDGEVAAKASAAELARGINLSNADGPITRQSREVLALIFRKNDRYFERWRRVQLYAFPDWAKGADVETRRQAELKRIDDEIAADEARLNEVRRPKVHRFEVRPENP